MFTEYLYSLLSMDRDGMFLNKIMFTGTYCSGYEYKGIETILPHRFLCFKLLYHQFCNGYRWSDNIYPPAKSICDGDSY